MRLPESAKTKDVFDNNMSPRYAAMLQALGVDVRPLRDMFRADIKDTDYLPQLRDCTLIRPINGSERGKLKLLRCDEAA